MGCTACTSKVQSVLESIEGVESCDVRLEDGVALVHFAHDEELSQSEHILPLKRECEKAVCAAGFTAAAALAEIE